MTTADLVQFETYSLLPHTVTEQVAADLSILLTELKGYDYTISVATIIDVLRHHKLFVAVDTGAGRTVGMCCLVEQYLPQGQRALLETFVIHPEYRNQRVGTLLMNAAVSELKRGNFPILNLTCNASRDVAARFYENYGFRVADTSVYRLQLPEDQR